MEIVKAGADVKLNNTSEQYSWIGLDPDEAIKNGKDPYVYKNLQRLKAWVLPMTAFEEDDHYHTPCSRPTTHSKTLKYIMKGKQLT